ncbi:MAG TPA: hypothetical protein VN445_04500 [Rectinemataceae bacterium]|nr:hypothetical protein [Rectinemataceae bacterium]
MKMKSLIAILVIALLAVSCAPKQAKVAEAAPVAASVAPADIKDVATWISTYDGVIAQYADVAAKLKGGDATQQAKNDELVKTASELDAVAETIKGTLTDQALTDFTAKAQEYKDKFASSASAN